MALRQEQHDGAEYWEQERSQQLHKLVERPEEDPSTVTPVASINVPGVLPAINNVWTGDSRLCWGAAIADVRSPGARIQNTRDCLP